MFFQDKITNIKPTDFVLEIGPGSQPHPRSNIFLEKEFDNLGAIEQRGFAEKIFLTKPIIYYKKLPFPFEDKKFDYVICSHVLEHVPFDELDFFISELQRIAKRGYLEFPTIFYELINYQSVHLWLMNYRSGCILFMDKGKFLSNNIHKIYREMFYSSDGYMFNVFKRYSELFFKGFEWDGEIRYKQVKDFDELVNTGDLNYFSKYFKNMANPNDVRSVKKLKLNKVFSMSKSAIRKNPPSIFFEFPKKENYSIYSRE